jgi:competence protein ComEC
MVLGGLAVLLGMLWRPLGQVVAWVAWPFPAFTIRAVEFFAGLPAASLALPSVGLPVVVLGYALLFGLTLAPRSLRERLGALRQRLPRPALTLALLALGVGTGLTWRQLADRPDGRTHFTLLDVGAGEAALIQSPTGRFVLVGGGPSPIALSEALGRQLPLFHRQLDWLVLAGAREEQVAGLVGVAERYPVGQAWIAGAAGGAAYRRVLEELNAASVPIHEMQPGAGLDLGGGARLKVLASGEHGAALLLTHGRARVLLAPGADPAMVEALAKDAGLAALTALLLPDGGYAAVNPTAWLQRLSPGLVLISVAAGNDRGLPSPEVVSWLQGRTVLRTDRDGWIELISDGQLLWAQAERAPSSPAP